ncbi:hypothetical protein XFLAVUS301_18870 [Xanthobacter flavus]|uniref:Uncharacterized protein n=1 Tax=Xanthobacter flavus TaxID=281 RepID=A0A9W6CGY2_XANFL|nr:hypothetical protein XFLAVUS301_18870 [Xanthobacter flavus]
MGLLPPATAGRDAGQRGDHDAFPLPTTMTMGTGKAPNGLGHRLPPCPVHHAHARLTVSLARKMLAAPAKSPARSVRAPARYRARVTRGGTGGIRASLCLSTPSQKFPPNIAGRQRHSSPKLAFVRAKSP